MPNYTILFFYVICILALSIGNAEANVEELLEQAKLKELSSSKQWQKLLHYKTYKSKQKSDVSSDSFFFDKNGRNDSSAELNTTIKTIFGYNASPKPNLYCKFPARIKWLSSQLNLSSEQTITFEKCENYQKWRMHGKIKSISLIFASGHLSNPASFYGHILLKFNSENEGEELNLLDTSLNFGAKPPEHENIFKYIAKGLTGGYQASFTNQQFYRHNHTYAENELRDLWNYELNLDQEQLEMLIDHSWELIGQEFTYYFLKQNCGYRMAELLNLVIDIPVLTAFKKWAMPSDLLVELEEIKNDGFPVVKKITLIDSRQNAFRKKFLLLDSTAKHTVSYYIKSQAYQNNKLTTDLPEASSKRVIDTLFDYYAFSLTKKDANIPEIEARKRHLLLQRLKLDTKETIWSDSPRASPPHESQKSSLIQLSPFYNNALGKGLEFRFRAAYYDYLSLNSGRAPFTQMSMFDIKFIQQNNNFSLRQLDILNIETLNPSPTGIQGDGGFAWKIKTGVKNSNLECANCLNGYIDGGIGKALSFGKSTAIYAMVVGEFVSFGVEKTQLKTGLTTGIITGYKRSFKTQLEAGILKSVLNRQKTQKFISWEGRVSNASWWDTRFKITYDKATETSISFGFYW